MTRDGIPPCPLVKVRSCGFGPDGPSSRLSQVYRDGTRIEQGTGGFHVWRPRGLGPEDHAGLTHERLGETDFVEIDPRSDLAPAWVRRMVEEMDRREAEPDAVRRARIRELLASLAKRAQEDGPGEG